ncbi:DoxX family protein [Nocardia yunnanensis]|uniref:DoxX family protein n=1 Tax=Nocardia yunnanensis TaxID=2382165 RepID=A0A386ZJ40_9NOCA|nr:DoxX family protein [Nocardia yunnanensis]AYF77872.1 DoxX family protein [Nocardia yunnanensis]
MFITYLVVAVVTIAINGGMAIADFARADFVLANSAAVRFPRSLIPVAGALKGAGALGVLIGLLGARPIGIAAALGLVLYFAIALVVHVRTGVIRNIAFPGAYFAFAAATLALAVAGR